MGTDAHRPTASADDVLPKGFHRIRHYGLFANGNRAADIPRPTSRAGCPRAFGCGRFDWWQ